MSHSQQSRFCHSSHHAGEAVGYGSCVVRANLIICALSHHRSGIRQTPRISTLNVFQCDARGIFSVLLLKSVNPHNMSASIEQSKENVKLPLC